MVTEPLVLPGDLDGYPGAPFPPEPVMSAVAGLRRAAGWHIAPSVTETVTLDHDGAGVLQLRSLYVTAVTSVKDVSTDTPTDLTGWRWSQDGMVSECFPCEFRTVEVTFTHGYAECPPDLLPVVASRTQRRVMQESVGARSVTYAADSGPVESAVEPYRLGPRP